MVSLENEYDEVELDEKASDELTRIFEDMLRKVQEPAAPSIFSEITDEDIDNLFKD